MITGLTSADLSLETLVSKYHELAGGLAQLQEELPQKDALIARLQDQLLRYEQQVLQDQADMRCYQQQLLQYQQEVLQYQQQLLQCQEEISQRDLQILKLSHELAQLKKLVFGSKSERFQLLNNDQQLALALDLQQQELPPLSPQQITYQRQQPAVSKHHGRLPLPAHLPRKQVILEPEGVDTSLWKKIGQEITEELDYVPCRLFVRQYVRPKYAHPSGEGVMIADLPERPIPKAIAGPALLAHIISSKFINHLPVYRQAQQFKREGVPLAASTINDWLKASCQLLEPLYQVLREQVVASDYLQVDESPIQVLDKDKKGSTHRGWHWVYHAPQKKQVLFDYRRGRGREGPGELLKDFQGYLQTDGYVIYDDFADKSGIVLLGCMAHARRKFVEAEKNYPQKAAHVLGQLQNLYALERKGKEDNLNEQQFLELRQQQAVPILQELKVWLLENYQQVTPQSPIGKAIAYSLPRWEKLCAYLVDVRLSIDNNLVENAIRPLALGRKNYLFAGSHEGASRAAMLYSFMGTCKLHQINPQVWLTDVLERIPAHPVNKLQQLLPGKWTPNLTPYGTKISNTDLAGHIAN
jgi:transposase